jgi:hypothetical protein
VDVHGFSDQIYNPVFLNSPLLVSSQLIARVIGERGVGDFNDKIDLSRRGMFLHPSLVKNDIWLGFVEMLDANRPSGAHSVAIVSLVAEDFGKGVDQVLVVISDGSHAKDLAIKEFDSFFWPENAGLRHPVILVDRKLPGSGFDGFGEKGLHRWLFNCAAGDGRNPEQKREMSATFRDRSPPRELIKRSGSMPLSWSWGGRGSGSSQAAGAGYVQVSQT